MGNQPYFSKKLIQEVIEYVTIDKGTLEVPNHCPDSIRNVMKNCWKYQPQDRFSFEKILSILLEGFVKLPKPNETQKQIDGIIFPDEIKCNKNVTSEVNMYNKK